ncbi:MULTISPECIES: serine/threonine-protein kinase [Streptomyces]|uniref:non-specific serine/threonine protein kinase n=1 Tax=Streptomyces mirabilis TaxID=68239 RepID=A0ABU3UMH8_9ACTN|nr:MULTISPECIES: serine/threonine-protein kinase [Streptomyces]MDU8995132.1 serine/threonine-protein kinase [Streptomyces mirabilis]QDN94243.1 serine/threonine protein kinase [Streptomyces sp. RLB3-6]QDO14658.1 serine/threonine protein kinase [Streptomyces sp. S1D4-23]
MQGLLLAGRYRLVESIGSGGMGRVWRAHDEVLHRAVAVKELTAALYVTESDRAVLLARTHAEARAAARINHSAVVTVHDVLDHDNRPWIVMELVEGNSLADEVKEKGRVEPTEAARIGLWVLRALRAAHSAGVLHRDVKPGNVLLSSDRRVLLTDFGIAQVEGDTTITRTGEIVGSVDYLAPERVRGHDPGPSADLWALGATLYTAVEGRSPFRRTSPLTTMQAVVDEEPAPPQHAGPLGPVITALLHKDPAVRPGAEEAEQMLAEAVEGRRPSAAQAYVPTQQHVDTGTMGMGAQRVAPYWTAPQGTGSHGAAPHGPGAHETASHGSVAHGSGAHGATPTLHAPVPGPPGEGTGSGGASGRRRRGRTIALVVVLAALIGGGGAVAMHYVNGARTGDTHNSASPGTTHPGTTKPGSTPTATSGSQEPSGAVPDTWVQRDDVEGFTISLPDKTWQRQANGNQVDYTPDGGKHFVRIAIDDSPDFPTPYAHQLDLEQQLTKLVDYHRVHLQSNTFRDCPGSLWDFTWTALPKQTPFPGNRRAIEQTYLSREGVEYAIYMSSPAADWDTARRQFDVILRSWLPKT